MAEIRARATVLIDNDRIRVTEWRFAAGATTGYHRHAHDYVVVPLTTGTLRLVRPDGNHDADLTHGVPYFRSAGVEHDVINVNSHPFTFIEMELK